MLDIKYCIEFALYLSVLFNFFPFRFPSVCLSMYSLYTDICEASGIQRKLLSADHQVPFLCTVMNMCGIFQFTFMGDFAEIQTCYRTINTLKSCSFPPFLIQHYLCFFSKHTQNNLHLQISILCCVS